MSYAVYKELRLKKETKESIICKVKKKKEKEDRQKEEAL